MRLVVTKVNPNLIIAGQALSVGVGIFDEKGAQQMEIMITGNNFIQKFGEVQVGQELRIIPAKIADDLVSLRA